MFERVLSAETLPAEDAKKIWTQFMEFEATVGDLSSIKKVEKRVLASMTVSEIHTALCGDLIIFRRININMGNYGLLSLHFHHFHKNFRENNITFLF